MRDSGGTITVLSNSVNLEIRFKHTETDRVEINSTKHDALAKTCVAAFSSSLCWVEKGTDQPRRYL
jgi:hypothetical protein